MRKGYFHINLTGTRSTRAMSLCGTELTSPSSQEMVTSLQDVPVTVPRSVVVAAQQTRSPTFSALDWSPVIGSICRSQTPHGELYLPVWQLSPMLHDSHIITL